MDNLPPTHSSVPFSWDSIKAGIVKACRFCATPMAQLSAAMAFYTCIPIPLAWASEFKAVARLAVVVGLLMGSLLGFLDASLAFLGMPDLTRSGVIVVAWIGLTGGLHLDGVMDTADGLAVQDPQRRLSVMADSATGAFGAMAAIALLLLKTLALSDLHDLRWLLLPLAAGWGRWGQQVAIACYPYLKPTGKGAFHKAAVRPFSDGVTNLLLLLGLSTLPMVLHGDWQQTLSMGLGGAAIALLTPAWFNRQLGGHTGDTYGAVVEWTEALLLILLTI